jgi:hypothetical protein
LREDGGADGKKKRRVDELVENLKEGQTNPSPEGKSGKEGDRKLMGSLRNMVDYLATLSLTKGMLREVGEIRNTLGDIIVSERTRMGREELEKRKKAENEEKELEKQRGGKGKEVRKDGGDADGT